MIDVYPDIKGLLEFKSTDDFYFLQIIKRRKENPQMEKPHRVIKSYYISSIEYFESHYQEIREMCIFFNARAMINLNKRSYKKVAFRTLENISIKLSNGEYQSIKNTYNSASGSTNASGDMTIWIIDIDEKIDSDKLIDIISSIDNAIPIGKKYIKKLETKNGIHILTKPFDSRGFKEIYPAYAIHRDNPINLFIP